VLWSKLADRLAANKWCSPEKTKIVYCKEANRRADFPNQSFDLIGDCKTAALVSRDGSIEVLQSALRCLADAAKGLESAGATERALGRWETKQKTAKATHVKIEICLAFALFNSET
jgi:hypothetical protein